MSAPKAWKPRTLRQLARINYGRSAVSILADDGVYPVYGTAGPERYGNQYLYDGESVILGRKGTIDRVHFADGKFWTIDTAYYLSDFRGAVPRWLYYRLQMLDLAHLNEATGVPSLSRETLYRIEIEVPEPPEQTEIAQVLVDVDRAIDNANAVIAKQRRIKVGLMNDLLLRGIDQNGECRLEQSHQFKNSPAGRIPIEWDPSTLERVGKWHSGGTPSKANPTFWGGEVPWLCPKDMKAFDLATTTDKLTPTGALHGSHEVPANSVFIVVRGMILAHTFPVTISSVPMAFNQDVKAIVAAPHVEPRFLAYWFVANAHKLLKITTTATHGTKRFDMAEVFAVPIALPKKDEQAEIVRRLDAATAEISANLKTEAKLRHLKAGLMQDLLWGRRRITPRLAAQPDATIQAV